MKTAIFAGTFDPPTYGHCDIIQRAATLCSCLYVAVATNQGKKPPLLSIEQRLDLLKSLMTEFSTIKVVTFSGLLVNFAKEIGAEALIRGVRNYADFEYECQMACANRSLTGIETVCLIASSQYQHVSSTLIREIANFGGPLEQFVPPIVAKHLYIPK